MTLERKAIRRAIRDRLDGATAAGARVFSQLVFDVEAAESLPVVNVRTGAERVEVENETPRRYRRELPVEVEAFHVANGAPADVNPAAVDELDDLAAQVERALFGALHLPELEGVALHRTAGALTGVRTGVELAGRAVAVAVLEYRLTYYTLAPEVDAAELAPLEGVGLGWDLAPPAGEADASDEVPIDQTTP